MSAPTKTATRQIANYSFLSQIANRATFNADQRTELDNLLSGINAELSPSFAMSANSTPNLVLNIGANIVSNAETGMRHMAPAINKQFPTFTGGTITLPASTGGTITVTPTVTPNPTLTMGANDYVAALIEVDSTGNLSVTLGTPQASEANALLPANLPGINAKARQIGLLIIRAISSSIQNVTPSSIIQFQGGGGAGSGGDGSGIADDLNALQFKASVTELLGELPSDPLTTIDYSTNKTPSSAYSSVNQYLRISYDGTLTVTGTGTSMTMSGTPSYTVVEGDVLVVGQEVRVITNVASQTSYTIDAAFTVNPSAAAAIVSQCVYTKELMFFNEQGNAIIDAFTDNISQIMVTYENSDSVNETIDDYDQTLIAFTASANDVDYTNRQVRATELADETQITNLPVPDQELYLRFFANRDGFSGQVNLLKYKVFAHREESFADGSLQNQAYAMTDGTGTPVNLTLSLVGGKTRATLNNWSYPVGLNSGTSNGALDVYLNGQKTPRFVDATTTPDIHYKEIDQRTIELDANYSTSNISLEIVYRFGSIDQSETNSTAVAQNQEQFGKGFQPFIDTTPVLAATTTTGAPATGRFYSTIQGRKPLLDLSQDLKARFGDDRFTIPGIYRIQDEYGPNGEQVWGAINDQFGQIRFIGSGWTSQITNNGQFAETTITNDAVEITFYGTHLNILCRTSGTRDFRASVDGGTEGSALPGFVGSTILDTRNYNPNQVVNVASGLTLGIHTVRIRNNAAGGLSISGIEFSAVDATPANIIHTPGSGFSRAKKLTSSSNVLANYTTGVTGTRGGRVVKYLNPDGTYGTAFRAVEASQLNLTSADHTNEEVARVYSFREFGANRADDFSTLTGSSNRAFTLEDGTTTLTGQTVIAATVVANTEESVRASTGGFLLFTFVGTGLDIKTTQNDGSARTTAVNVDGSSIGNISTAANEGPRTVKVVSGLPYGTHTVRFSQSSNDTVFINSFLVYQPKKPSIPAGAIEVADFNVMADFVANSTSGLETIARGVLRKAPVREAAYIGGLWGSNLLVTEHPCGFDVNTNTTAHSIREVFFGTGFDFRGRTNTTGMNTINISLNGVALTTTNFPTAVFSTYGGYSFNSATGVLNGSVSNTVGSGFRVSGLPLGWYRFDLTTASTATPGILFGAFDIITPVHSYSSALPYDLQNSLPVGSQSLADSRQFSPVKIESPKKVKAQAIGTNTGGLTTSSTQFIPMPDMSVTVSSRGAWFRITPSFMTAQDSGTSQFNQIYINGQPEGKEMVIGGQSAGNLVISYSRIFYLSPGFHKIDAYWRVNAGTGTLQANNYRVLLVEEID